MDGVERFYTGYREVLESQSDVRGPSLQQDSDSEAEHDDDDV